MAAALWRLCLLLRVGVIFDVKEDHQEEDKVDVHVNAVGSEIVQEDSRDKSTTKLSWKSITTTKAKIPEVLAWSGPRNKVMPVGLTSRALANPMKLPGQARSEAQRMKAARQELLPEGSEGT